MKDVWQAAWKVLMLVEWTAVYWVHLKVAQLVFAVAVLWAGEMEFLMAVGLDVWLVA